MSVKHGSGKHKVGFPWEAGSCNDRYKIAELGAGNVQLFTAKVEDRDDSKAKKRSGSRGRQNVER